MTKYRVILVVEATDVADAVNRFIYDMEGETVRGVLSLEVDNWE